MKYQRNIGTFANMEALVAQYPSGGVEGDYCIINDEPYYWSESQHKFVKQESENPVPLDVVKATDAQIRQTKVVYGDLDVHHDINVGGILNARMVRGRNAFCGLFEQIGDLKYYYPKPSVGMWALIEYQHHQGDMAIGEVWICHQRLCRDARPSRHILPWSDVSAHP